LAIVYFLLGPLVTVWKSGSDVFIRPYGVLPEIRSRLLMSVNYANRKYIINKVSRAFFVLRGLKSAQPDLYKLGYKLKEGTVMKFGKTKFIVKELWYPKYD